MILIPQSLFQNPNVHPILRDGNVCVLEKSLSEPVVKKEGYITNHVISFVRQGRQFIQTYDGELIQVNPGEIAFFPRGLYYVTDLLPDNGDFKSTLFYFDDELIHEFLSNTRATQINRDKTETHLKLAANEAIKSFVNFLHLIYQQNGIKNKSFLRLKILEMLYLVNEMTGDERLASFLFRLTLPEKRNIKAFMEANFDKALKIEDYAYLTGRSISTFRRDFKSSFHITPQKWIKEQRLNKAVKIIEKKELAVAELAYEVGYDNTSYFIREFRNHVGQSPKQYMLDRHRNKIK